jgi:hypothetical protein
MQSIERRKSNNQANPEGIQVPEAYLKKTARIRTKTRQVKHTNLTTATIIGLQVLSSINVSSAQEIKTGGYYVQQGYELVQEPSISGKPIYQSNKLEYQIKALKETKADWVAYEINGFTDKGWWYQTGLYYDIKLDKFSLIYEIWDGRDRSHAQLMLLTSIHGQVDFDTKVNEKDDVRIALEIKNDRIYMNIRDLNTGSEAKTDFEAEGTRFNWNVRNGFFTGPMTETFSYNGVGLNLQRQEYYRISGPMILTENNLLFFENVFHADLLTGQRITYKNLTYKMSNEEKQLLPNTKFTVNGQTKLIVGENPGAQDHPFRIPTETFITISEEEKNDLK